MTFLQALYGCSPADERLLPLTPAMYRTRWNKLFSNLGLPVSEADRGVTPGSLRGSGATWLYYETENIFLIQWRGRWRRVATLESYLQEVAAELTLAAVSQANRDRIVGLASLAAPALQSCIAELPC